MKIVVDANIPLAEEFFSLLGEVTLIPPRELSAEKVRDADVLIVRSVVRIGKELLENSRVKFVGSCTAGVDHLDTAYLDEKNITWTGAPGCNANAVVEYVLSVFAMLYKDRNVDWWNRSVGIVGCGNVGGRLYKKLTALGVVCHCYDPLLPVKTYENLTTLDNVLACDIVCVHAPLTKIGPFPSYHLLGEKELNQLKLNAVLISAGRGAVVDNQALISLLKKRSDITAVLDVWEDEPIISDELLNLVALGTPHIAGHSYDGKVLGTDIIYNKLCEFLQIEPKSVLSDFVSSIDASIPIPSGDDIYAQLSDVILSAHDVREDDRQLREALVKTDSSNKESRGAVFDQLRKNYKKRREFSHYTVEIDDDIAIENQSQSQSQTLSIDSLEPTLHELGFNVRHKLV